MTEPQGDWHMEAARLFAEGLGPAPALPGSLADIQRRAEFVHQIDGRFIPNRGDVALFQELGARLAELAEKSRTYMPDLEDGLARVNVSLRLWAGCLSAAKTIALETSSGPNTPEGRAGLMQGIDAIAAHDPIYAAGIEAAPAFKRLRAQPYSLEGVPPASRVRHGDDR
jgi:outer membrane murein-binding lipoprotein Lpp